MKLRNAMFGLVSLVAAACGPQGNCYHGNYLNITNYKVSIDEYTPKGIGIDQPNNPEHKLDPNEIDWLVDHLESCLNENFAKNPVISEEQAKNAWCMQKEFYNPITIKRECISVKVPDDLYHSQCSEQWLFPCNIDQQLCKDKGLNPGGNCPCHCRAMVQDDNVVITNHMLNVFLAETARIVTSCNNTWAVDQITPCVTNPHFNPEDWE